MHVLANHAEHEERDRKEPNKAFQYTATEGPCYFVCLPVIY